MQAAASTAPVRAFNRTGENGTALTCESVEAVWARSLLGSPTSEPLPELSGVWVDEQGRELRVCTLAGALSVLETVSQTSTTFNSFTSGRSLSG